MALPDVLSLRLIAGGARVGLGRAALEAAARAIPGVVDTGLFLGTAERVMIGDPDGRSTSSSGGPPEMALRAEVEVFPTREVLMDQPALLQPARARGAR